MQVILQTQRAECGLACLAMICAHHGNGVGLREIRRRYGASQHGLTLGKVMAIAKALGLNGRAVRVDLENMRLLDVPCIIHWGLDHFVVLEKVRHGRAWIIDPATGRRMVGGAELFAKFTGVALELNPSASFERMAVPPAVSIRQLTGRVGGLFRSLLNVVGLSLALQVLLVLSPFFMQWVIDHVLVSGDSELLTILGISFGALLILQVGTAQLRGWTVINVSSSLGLQWARNIFSHLLKLPLDYFEKRHLGDLVTRMGSVHAIKRTLTTSFVEAMIDGVMALVTIAIMFTYSWKLTLISLLALGIYVAVRSIAFRPLRVCTEEHLVALSSQQSHLLESLRGILTLKLAGSNSLRESNYHNLSVEATNKEIRLARLSLLFSGSNKLVFGAERIAVVLAGAQLVLGGMLSVGMLVAFIAFKDQFSQRVGVLVDRLFELRMLRLHTERLADIALSTPEVDTELGSDRPMSAPPRLDVCDVRFSYSPTDPVILENCTFSVGRGETVAIVGPSGCGKSTLAKVILGLLQPQSGAVSVNGEDIRHFGTAAFRKCIGAVMQDDRLFAGSIVENIAFGEEVADMGQVVEAARRSAIHDDIVAMPMGYHSLIGDMGTILSGGQKQRVLLARALYKKPCLLVLDEATSHLDLPRERSVNQEIKSLGLTTVVIAHRRETIAAADRVIKLGRGRVSEWSAADHESFRKGSMKLA